MVVLAAARIRIENRGMHREVLPGEQESTGPRLARPCVGLVLPVAAGLYEAPQGQDGLWGRFRVAGGQSSPNCNGGKSGDRLAGGVRLHRVDHSRDVIGVDLGVDAVAEVEDVAGVVTIGIQDPGRLVADHLR